MMISVDAPSYPQTRIKVTSRPYTVSRTGMTFVVIALIIWGSSLAIGFARALTLLVAVGFAAAIIGLFRPAVGLLGIGILCTVDAIARFYVLGAHVLPWNTLNYWLLIVMVLYFPLLLRFQPLSLQILYLFLAVMALQLLYTTNLIFGLQHLLGIFITPALVIYFLRAARQDDNWIWMAIVNGVVAGAGGLMYYLHKSSLEAVNPNAASYFPLTALFSICLAFPFARRHFWTQLTLLALAMTNFAWVFLSGSRGALFIGACCLAFLVHRFKGLSQRTALFIIALIILGGAFAHFDEMKSFTLQRIQKLWDDDHTFQERTSGRSDIVRVGWRMFLEYPLGVGTGSFREYYPKVSELDPIDFKPGQRVDAHAGWIKTLAENGLIGFSLFAAFVFSFAYVGWVRRRVAVLPIGLLVTVVLSVAFLSTEFQGKGLWFLAAGALILLSRRARVSLKRPAASG